MAINTTIPNVIEGEIKKLPLNDNFDWALDNLIDLQAQTDSNDVDIANRYTKVEVDSKDTNLQSQVTTNKNTMDSHIASTTAHDANNIVLTSENPYLTANNVESGLEQISDRVSTIIAQSGTSSTEVVDSRTSSTYGVFTTLGNRLNSSDIKLKVIEDEINTQNVGTLALTPTTSVQSVTDSYSGIIDAEIGGATLYQAVTQGNATTSIVSPNGTGRAFGMDANGLWTLWADTTFNAAHKKYKFTSGQKYYLLAIASSGLLRADQIALRYSDNTVVNFGTNLVNGLIASVVFTADKSLEANIGVRENSGGNTTTINRVFQVLIPITGTPYESYTADQINAMVTEYWEGLKSTEQVEINTSGVQLFDKNKPILPSAYTVKNYLGEDCISYLAGSSVNNVPLQLNVKWKQNTVYTFKLEGATLDGSQTFLKIYYTDGTSATLASISGTPFAEIIFSTAVGKTVSGLGGVWSNNQTVYIKLSTFQINEGSTALPYSDYSSSTININCTDNTKFSLSKLPNNIQNEINFASSR